MTAAARKLKPEPAIGFDLSIKCGTLASAMKRAAEIASGKLNIPILNHVRLTAEPTGLLVVRACDTNRSLAVAVEADVSGDGDLCLPAQPLRNLVEGWWSGNAVTLRAEENGRVAVASGRSRYRLASLEPQDFPQLGWAGNDAASFTLPGPTLAEALSRVSWAMESDQTTRPHLCGVYLHTVGDRLVFVATNGKAMAKWEQVRPEGMADLSGIIIPDSALGILGKLAEAGAVTLAMDERKLSAAAGDVRFTTKLVEGSFPDYRRVIPEPSPERSARVDRVALLAALRRLEALQDGDGIVRIEPGEGGIALAPHRGSQLGEGTEDIEAETAGDIRFAVNRRFLAPALSAFSGEHVVIKQREPGQPLRLTGAAEADAGLTAVVMPALA